MAAATFWIGYLVTLRLLIRSELWRSVERRMLTPDPPPYHPKKNRRAPSWNPSARRAQTNHQQRGSL